MKTLIATAWWPTKSRLFSQYAQGVITQLEENDAEMFITTSFAESKFESIVRSMVAAEQYALNQDFTHLLNVEADMQLAPGFLDRLLKLEKPVVVVAHDERPEKKSRPGNFQTLIDSRIGWGAMLVSCDVLQKIPFESAFRGDYLTPDRLWFKRLLMENIPVWIEANEKPHLLEKAESGPRRAFIGG